MLGNLPAIELHRERVTSGFSFGVDSPDLRLDLPAAPALGCNIGALGFVRWPPQESHGVAAVFVLEQAVRWDPSPKPNPSERCLVNYSRHASAR